MLRATFHIRGLAAVPGSGVVSRLCEYNSYSCNFFTALYSVIRSYRDAAVGSDVYATRGLANPLLQTVDVKFWNRRMQILDMVNLKDIGPV